MEKLIAAVGAIVVVLAIAALIALLIAWPVEALWNDLMPGLVGIRTITFGEALELSLLCSLLFKSSSSSKDD